MRPLLQVGDLHVRYRAPARMADLIPGRARRANRAVNGVSMDVARGESLGLVGESGCGKSTLGRAILRLTSASAGTVCFDGENVLEMGRTDLLRFRRRAQMVFQDPYASLNPRLTVAETLSEVLRVHELCPANEIASRVNEFNESSRSAGGACLAAGALTIRRTMSARRHCSRARSRCRADRGRRAGFSARRLDPGADPKPADPAAARDGTDAAVHLARSRRSPSPLPTRGGDVSRPHRRGRTRRTRSSRNPRHPYTQALLAAIPRMEPTATLPAAALAGEPPSPLDAPTGCPFHPRCPHAMPVCRSGDPPSFRAAGEALVACHLYPEEDLRSLTAMSTGSESAP